MFAGVGPEQEVAAAVLLHDLGPREARQLAEAVGAVDDGVAAVALGVTQQEVTVCSKAITKRCVKNPDVGRETKKHSSRVFWPYHVLIVLFFFALESKLAYFFLTKAKALHLPISASLEVQSELESQPLQIPCQ